MCIAILTIANRTCTHCLVACNFKFHARCNHQMNKLIMTREAYIEIHRWQRDGGSDSKVQSRLLVSWLVCSSDDCILHETWSYEQPNSVSFLLLWQAPALLLSTFSGKTTLLPCITILIKLTEMLSIMHAWCSLAAPSAVAVCWCASAVFLL